MGLAWDILYAGAGAVSSPVWGYKLWATGKWRTDWRARRGFGDDLPPLDGPGRRLLIHGVSVGEVNAIRNLLDLLHQRDPALQVVVSTTTDTGMARAVDLFTQNHTVVRYPLDFSRCVERFLDRVRPTAVALVELELWPNFAASCQRRGIPLGVINGRLSSRSYSWYHLGRPLVRRTFASLAAAGVQTQEYARRFVGLGTLPDRVKVLDTMKWDTAKIIDHVPGAAELALAMGIDPRSGITPIPGTDPVAPGFRPVSSRPAPGTDPSPKFQIPNSRRPLIVAGSTGPGEEEMLIRTCPPGAQLLLVPRKPERFAQVAALLPAPGIVRRTSCPDGAARPPDGAHVFLLDTMGELNKAYALADVAIVGRSFLGLYGSDMMEPIALGKPTIVGPCHGDFLDTVNALRAGEGLIVTDRPGPEAFRLLADPAAARKLAENGRRVIQSRQGATARHADMLLKMMG